MGNDKLRFARELIAMGAPVFVAKPGGKVKGYRLPAAWERTPLTEDTLSSYEEGDALGMVCGHALDAIDVDPVNGGTLEGLPELPRVYAEANTPSGGKHYIIKSLGITSRDDTARGVDIKAGRDGEGHGFVFIYPTVAASKDPADEGRRRPYVFSEKRRPSAEEFAEWSDSDDSGAVWAGYVAAVRATPKEREARTAADDPFASNPEHVGSSDQREFTVKQAQEFVRGSLTALAAAQLGQVEARATAAAAQLAHFVPEFWSADQAYALLLKSAQRSLGGTWEDGYGGSWTLDKFKLVLDGRRPLGDNWKAVKREETGPATTTAAAILNERSEKAARFKAALLRFEDLAEQKMSNPLIKGILDLGAETWLIGQPGGYKSFVAVDWACHVALGREWRGRKTVQGSVVYLAAEGASGIAKRIIGWSQQYEMEPKDLYVLPLDIQVLQNDFPAFQDAIEDLAPKLVVIDTQARVTVGMEENSSKEMGLAIKAFKEIKERLGCTLVIVHHSAKNSDDIRGSSAQRGAGEWVWNSAREVKKGGKLAARLWSTKSKDGDQDQEFRYIMNVRDVGLDEDGDAITTLVCGDEIQASDIVTYEDTVRQLDEDARWKGEQARIVKALKTLTAGGHISASRSELFTAYNDLRKASTMPPVSRSTFNTTLNRIAADEEDQMDRDPSYKPEVSVSATRVEYRAETD